ncbi:long-chain fatty acid--CoA ligase [Treponema sp.]|uniref:AMP-dependent synthetase/ligase n=1 Tax=Treponema sp. TaxID=166 RepID=UPI0025FE39B1|nr:AMP-binding protein [Treponema sp.]MCR5217742.1 AMP-binding protein [Treponema sp.]
MQSLKNYNPTYFLDDFKGTYYSGEWPTLPEIFTITVKRFGSRNAFTDWDTDDNSKRTYSYETVYQQVQNLAQWMIEKGIVKGDKIAVTGKNSPEWATVYLAALFAGATICPMDYALHENELENLLSTACPKMLFVDTEKFDYFNNKKNNYSVFALNRKNQNYVYTLKASKEIQLNQMPAENDIAAILFTSGTTGKPKGVMLSHRNLVSDAFIAQYNMIINEQDVFYALLPIHHAYTMLAVFIESICIGAEIVFGKSMAVSKLMKELKEGKITMLLGVPLLFNKLAAGILKGIKEKGPLVNALMKILMEVSYLIKIFTGINIGHKLFAPVLKQANINTIRIAICGGGPLAKSVFKLYNKMGIDFVQGYGLTETSPIIALNPVQHFKIQSVGQYFAGHMEMKILNPNEDGVGEICVKGPMVMQGYYHMPEETTKMFTEDGWFKTGDLGWIDKENYLMLSGRCKNMIVTEGGKNVYPEEIEDSFQLETDIQQITVQGYIANEDKKSEELEALIYPSDSLFEKLNIKREDNSPAASEQIYKTISNIVSKINKELQPYQRITKITILEKPLEMTTTMKVKRNYKK